MRVTPEVNKSLARYEGHNPRVKATLARIRSSRKPGGPGNIADLHFGRA
ncbi:MAG TPA: hypothetical protein VGF36_10015 [Rhodopila sp.]|jgi:hypothetical protein